jgi:hypothetical protein
VGKPSFLYSKGKMASTKATQLKTFYQSPKGIYLINEKYFARENL